MTALAPDHSPTPQLVPPPADPFLDVAAPVPDVADGPEPASDAPVLTAAEVAEVPSQRDGRRARNQRLSEDLQHAGSQAERHDLEQELIEANLEVARSIASRYRGRGIPLEDLEQVALLALTKAARRYDPDAGFPFLAFCVPTVRGEVRRYFRDQGWMVRPPRSLQELQYHVLKAQSALAISLGRPPTHQELAEHLDEPVESVREALNGHGSFSPTSLDSPVGHEGDSSPLGELLGEEDAAVDAAEARVVLTPAVERLGERDRHILSMRFTEGLTQREIAEDIGVTQMQVSRLLTRIFRDLRNDIGEVEPPHPRAS